MGIQATVVHDGVKHRPLVLRALSASPAELHGLSDTIASFSEHIAALRGTVNSPVEVCARWGGPPYISYTVVAKRFRVIVIWADDPGELDLAQDVHDCVVALHDAVVSAADALARDDPAALETVYNAAGAALRGASPPPEVAAQTASAPAPVKRASGLRALFGRTLKSGTGVVTGQSQSRRSAFRPPSARVSARRPPTPPSEEGAAVPKKDEDLPFDDAPSALHLPDSVFTWADFGDPLPPSGGDIAWIAELLRGDAQRRRTARPRILDAPLAQPSEGANAPRDSAVGTPPVGVTIPPPLQEQMLPGPAIPLSAPGAPAVTEQAAPIPQRATAQAAAIVPPSVQPPPSTQPVPVLPAQPVQPSSQTGQSIPVTANGTHSAVPVPPAVPSSAPAGSSVGPTGITSNMPAEMPSAMPAAMPSAIPAPVPAPVVPAVLARPQSSADEFDVSALGGYKDEATQGGGSAGGAGGTDAIRGMMNEFAKSMQTGNFQKALAQVSATLRALAGISPRRERETMACAHYALAQKILLRCQVLDRQISTAGAGSVLGIQSAVQAAVLAMFLAELKNLLPRHRLAAMRMALDKNIAVGNFGMAARWIRQIAEKAPPAQRQALGAKLQMCVQNGEVNKHMPPTNKLCYNLLTVLSGPYGKCTVCTAVYRPGLSGVNIGQSCPTCFAGSIVIAQ